LPGFYWYASPDQVGVVIAEVGAADTGRGLYVQLASADVWRPIRELRGEFRGPVHIERDRT
jgi:hypothetical protein